MEAQPLAPTHLALPIVEMQAVADYLQSRPWREVDGMLQALKAAQPVNVVTPSEDDA